MTDEEYRLEQRQQKEEKKEKRKRELKKISSLHGRAKLQYLWDYYKIVLVILVFVIIGISVAVNMVRGAMTDTVFQAGVISADFYATDQQIKPDFEAYIGGLDKHQNTSYDLSIMLQPGDMSQAAQVSEVKLQVALSSRTLDALLIPESQLEYVQKMGVLQSLDDVLSQNEKARYEKAGDLAFFKPAAPAQEDAQTSLTESPAEQADTALQEADAEKDTEYTVRDEGERIYGVRVDDSGVLVRYAFYPADEKVYLAIAAGARNEQMAHTFLNFLKGEEYHE